MPGDRRYMVVYKVHGGVHSAIQQIHIPSYSNIKSLDCHGKEEIVNLICASKYDTSPQV